MIYKTLIVTKDHGDHILGQLLNSGWHIDSAYMSHEFVLFILYRKDVCP